MPISKKNDVNLMDFGNDLLDANKESEFTEFIEATQNAPLTPKVAVSQSIMDMYNAPMEKNKPTNPHEANNNMFPINHNYMSTMNYMGNNSMGWPQNMQNNMGFRPGMNSGYSVMGQSGNIPMNGMYNMNNMNNLNNLNNMSNMGMHNNNNQNKSAEKKTKNFGDIMNLYNTKNDTSLSGAEMQMNKKGMGQENIMGMYSGKNFNVW